MEFIRRRFRPGYNHYNVSKLVGDASARQYYRYITDSGDSYILAAYPEPFDETNFTYKQVYDLLRETGLPVPRIEEMSGEMGIVLQEDLGNESLQKRLMQADHPMRRGLICQAVDHIVTLQSRGTEALRPEYEASRLAFDEEKLHWELNFFKRYYLGQYRQLQELEEERLQEEFRRLSKQLAGHPRRLCHRDYHVRNLMLKNEILYIIDFQDARWGPLSYDLVSLLKDSIDLGSEEVEEYREYYLRQAALRGGEALQEAFRSGQAFRREFHLMCIQRLLKALGTYGYQIVVRGNFIYEQYMAGSLHRTLLALQAVPEFPYIRTIVEQELESR